VTNVTVLKSEDCGFDSQTYYCTKVTVLKSEDRGFDSQTYYCSRIKRADIEEIAKL
jgi:hypothetical protein